MNFIHCMDSWLLDEKSPFFYLSNLHTARERFFRALEYLLNMPIRSFSVSFFSYLVHLSMKDRLALPNVQSPLSSLLASFAKTNNRPWSTSSCVHLLFVCLPRDASLFVTFLKQKSQNTRPFSPGHHIFSSMPHEFAYPSAWDGCWSYKCGEGVSFDLMSTPPTHPSMSCMCVACTYIPTSALAPRSLTSNTLSTCSVPTMLVFATWRTGGWVVPNICSHVHLLRGFPENKNSSKSAPHMFCTLFEQYSDDGGGGGGIRMKCMNCRRLLREMVFWPLLQDWRSANEFIR